MYVKNMTEVDCSKKKGKKKPESQNFSLTETVIIKYKSRDHPILL